MSAKQVSLKSPVTIFVVVALLVGVVFLNVSTFGGAAGSSSRGYRVQAHPPVPLDAGRLAGCETGMAELGNRRATSFSADGLKRDPFFPGEAQPKPVMRPKVKTRKRATKSRPRPKPLEGSAIMLGGNQSMAIINGEGRHPGDKLQGMILTAIDADGVTFRKTDGSTVHLFVGVQEDENQAFRVVTRTRNSQDQGLTHLVDQ